MFKRVREPRNNPERIKKTKSARELFLNEISKAYLIDIYLPIMPFPT